MASTHLHKRLSRRDQGPGRIASRLACEQGFTLVEVLMAAVLMSTGVVATVSVFGSSSRSGLLAQRQDTAAHVAQAELDKLSVLSYDQLVLTGQPPSSNDPYNPGYRVAGPILKVKSGLNEVLVRTATGGTPTVDPGPTAYAVGSGGATITGEIYRYVTWRDENCPSGLCDGSHNTKRAIVAVTVDPSGTIRVRPPTWISTIVTDHDAAPPSSGQQPDANPGSGSYVTADSYYLYDTPCSNNTRQSQSGSHATRDTASTGSGASNNSTCENPDSNRQPDLMGLTAPPNPYDPGTPPLYTYSSDLSGSYPGGLALARGGASCPTSYPSSDAANASAPANKWKLHTWATPAFPSAYHLNGGVTMALYTLTASGTTKHGKLCTTLIDRVTNAGVPTDTVLGSVVYDLASWPGTPGYVVYTFNLPQAVNIAASHRLVLAMSVQSSSEDDLVLLYDHPTYPSFLVLDTTP